MDRKTYIKILNENLSRLPAAQKEDILKEIDQHINDALANGEKEEAVLSRLGDPKLLARACAAEYYVAKNNFLKALPFLMSTAFSGLFIVPFLACSLIGFGAGAVVSTVAGIMRFLGAAWIPMTFLYMPVPQVWSIPFALMIALVFALIAFLSGKCLLKYCKRVISGYKDRVGI